MNLQWPALLPTVLCAALTLAAYGVRRAEQQSGRALLGWQVFSWTADRYPTLFKMRLASYWLFIAIFGLAAVAFAAEFLGIVR